MSETFLGNPTLIVAVTVALGFVFLLATLLAPNEPVVVATKARLPDFEPRYAAPPIPVEEAFTSPPTSAQMFTWAVQDKSAPIHAAEAVQETLAEEPFIEAPFVERAPMSPLDLPPRAPILEEVLAEIDEAAGTPETEPAPFTRPFERELPPGAERWAPPPFTAARAEEVRAAADPVKPEPAVRPFVPQAPAPYEPSVFAQEPPPVPTLPPRSAEWDAYRPQGAPVDISLSKPAVPKTVPAGRPGVESHPPPDAPLETQSYEDAPRPRRMTWTSLVDESADELDLPTRLKIIEALGLVGGSWSREILARAYEQEMDATVRGAIFLALRDSKSAA